VIKISRKNDKKIIEIRPDKRESEVVQPEVITGPEMSKPLSAELRDTSSAELRDTSSADFKKQYSSE